MSQPIRILVALVVGLAIGIAAAAAAPVAALRWTGLAEPIGTAWLNGLRMTIVPLVVGLLVTGIAQTAEAARAGKLATRSILFFIAVLWTSSILSAVLTPLFLGFWPLDPGAASALRASFTAAAPRRAGPLDRRFLPPR